MDCQRPQCDCHPSLPWRFLCCWGPHTLVCAKQLHTLISLCATPLAQDKLSSMQTFSESLVLFQTVEYVEGNVKYKYLSDLAKWTTLLCLYNSYVVICITIAYTSFVSWYWHHWDCGWSRICCARVWRLWVSSMLWSSTPHQPLNVSESKATH